MKFKLIVFLLFVLGLVGCNSVTMTHNVMEPGAVVYAERGGFSMRHSIKHVLEQRGYDVVVGVARSSRDSDATERDNNIVADSVRYVVKVSERGEKFRPVWCALNGFWWWNFTVSISDQTNGHEILAWRGRGCANSSVRMLNRIMEKLEK